MWRGEIDSKDNSKDGAGHVAMIIGIKKENNTVKELYVGEATWSTSYDYAFHTGNRLTKYDLSKSSFFKSWSIDNEKYHTFLIKMDKVYNYYSSEGNTKGYTDMFNEEFLNAI